MDIQRIGLLEIQSGGHGNIIKCSLSGEEKPIICKKITFREEIMYNFLVNTLLSKHISKYYGKYNIDNEAYIGFENAIEGFKSPCVADLKLGIRCWDLNSSEDKRERMKAKQLESIAMEHGVRLGDVTLSMNGKIVKNYGGALGYTQKMDEFVSMMHEFLPGNLLNVFRKKMNVLTQDYSDFLIMNPGFRYYSGSLLVAYDNDKLSHDENDLVVLLIDFAHSYEDVSRMGYDINDKDLDDNVLLGLKTLKDIPDKYY